MSWERKGRVQVSPERLRGLGQTWGEWKVEEFEGRQLHLAFSLHLHSR